MSTAERRPSAGRSLSLWDASIHAATWLGAREYSRSNPPSLERQAIGPVGLTARRGPFGGWS
jgi:hypothetical protein